MKKIETKELVEQVKVRYIGDDGLEYISEWDAKKADDIFNEDKIKALEDKYLKEMPFNLASLTGEDTFYRVDIASDDDVAEFEHLIRLHNHDDPKYDPIAFKTLLNYEYDLPATFIVHVGSDWDCWWAMYEAQEFADKLYKDFVMSKDFINRFKSQEVIG